MDLEPTSRVHWLVWILTLAWIVAASVLLWCDLSTRDTPLEINQLGDYLAGVAAPLAFMWLVVGYFQQASQIRQNTSALKLQLLELQQSVLQQEKLAAAAKEQCDLMVQSAEDNARTLAAMHQPIFEWRCGEPGLQGNRKKWPLSFYNRAAQATDLKLSPSPSPDCFDVELLNESFDLFETPHKYTSFALAPVEAMQLLKRFRIRAEYTDRIGERRSEVFEFTLNRNEVARAKKLSLVPSSPIAADRTDT